MFLLKSSIDMVHLQFIKFYTSRISITVCLRTLVKYFRFPILLILVKILSKHTKKEMNSTQIFYYIPKTKWAQVNWQRGASISHKKKGTLFSFGTGRNTIFCFCKKILAFITKPSRVEVGANKSRIKSECRGMNYNL